MAGRYCGPRWGGLADAPTPGAFLLPSPDQNECIIANPAFVVYSSIVSFYVPFIVTLLVYIKIYIVLRRRRKRVNTKRSSRAFRANLKAPLKVPRPPLPQCLCLTVTRGAGQAGVQAEGARRRADFRAGTSVGNLSLQDGEVGRAWRVPRRKPLSERSSSCNRLAPLLCFPSSSFAHSSLPSPFLSL